MAAGQLRPCTRVVGDWPADAAAVSGVAALQEQLASTGVPQPQRQSAPAGQLYSGIVAARLTTCIGQPDPSLPEPGASPHMEACRGVHQGGAVWRAATSRRGDCVLPPPPPLPDPSLACFLRSPPRTGAAWAASSLAALLARAI